MGIPVMILGESGTGKSASLRNFKPEEAQVINVAGKPLPFKNKLPSQTTDSYATIKGLLKHCATQGFKTIVIDDSQYLMANEFMRRATERGYDKFTEIAQNMWELVNTVKSLPSDTIVYFLTHLERDQNGNEKVKTIGKLLDEKITLEGMFTIVLKTNVTDGQYSFLTQNSGHDTVKSPIGLFPTYAIDNDLKYVDEKIRNYYELGEFLSDEEIKEIDKAAGKVDFEPSDGKKKSRRKKAADNDAQSDSEEPASSEDTKSKRTRRKATEDTEEESKASEDESKETSEESPKRKRRTTASEESEAMPKPEEQEQEKSAEAPRRRRRRSAE